jgi:hypothetical protein
VTKRDLVRIKKMNEKIWNLTPFNKKPKDKTRGKASPRDNMTVAIKKGRLS